MVRAIRTKGQTVPGDLQHKYDTLIASGDMFHDPAQIKAIQKLEDIRSYLESTSARKPGKLGPQIPRIRVWVQPAQVQHLGRQHAVKRVPGHGDAFVRPNARHHLAPDGSL